MDVRRKWKSYSGNLHEAFCIGSEKFEIPFSSFKCSDKPRVLLMDGAVAFIKSCNMPSFRNIWVNSRVKKRFFAFLGYFQILWFRSLLVYFSCKIQPWWVCVNLSFRSLQMYFYRNLASCRTFYHFSVESYSTVGCLENFKASMPVLQGLNY